MDQGRFHPEPLHPFRGNMAPRRRPEGFRKCPLFEERSACLGIIKAQSFLLHQVQRLTGLPRPDQCLHGLLGEGLEDERMTDTMQQTGNKQSFKVATAVQFSQSPCRRPAGDARLPESPHIHEPRRDALEHRGDLSRQHKIVHLVWAEQDKSSAHRVNFSDEGVE